MPDDPSGPVQHVILISVDGLRPDAITRLGEAELPGLYRFRKEGAFTDNARTDYDYTITLPNHTTQLTGHAVTGPGGHKWIRNSDPAPGETLHTNRGAYLASVFDVAHDHGLRTAAYVSKSKFVLIDRSYDGEHGAPDTVGVDDGRDKIDAYVYEDDTGDLVSRLIQDVQAEPLGFVFLHLRDPDSNGHDHGWNLNPGSDYAQAIRHVDQHLVQLFAAVESSSELAGKTAIILTADHGGTGSGHGDPTVPEHYTVPFYVWGAGVTPAELYELNTVTRRNPGASRPGYDQAHQPIRNGDAANLALSLLGLSPVPGSTINTTARLAVDGEPQASTVYETPERSTVLTVESVYPNPSRGRTNLNLTGTERGTYRVVVANQLGQVVYDAPFDVSSGEQYTLPLDLSAAASGVYFVRVERLGPGTRTSARMVLVK